MLTDYANITFSTLTVKMRGTNWAYVSSDIMFGYVIEISTLLTIWLISFTTFTELYLSDTSSIARDKGLSS